MIKKNQDDCGCDGNCCTPETKRPNWMKWTGIVVLVAAISIVTVKVVSEQTATPVKKEAAAVCDTTGGKACDTAQGSSCCPKTTN